MANKGTCRIEGCDKDVQGKGYCSQHYKAWRRGKLPKARYRSCNAQGCTRPSVRRVLCPEHYAAAYSKAKPQADGAAAPAESAESEGSGSPGVDAGEGAAEAPA